MTVRIKVSWCRCVVIQVLLLCVVNSAIPSALSDILSVNLDLCFEQHNLRYISSKQLHLLVMGESIDEFPQLLLIQQSFTMFSIHSI